MTRQNTTHPSAPAASIDASRVARRSLVLAAVVCRGSIDHGAGQPEAEFLHKRIVEWLTKLDLWCEVETSEEKILKAPFVGTKKARSEEECRTTMGK